MAEAPGLWRTVLDELTYSSLDVDRLRGRHYCEVLHEASLSENASKTNGYHAKRKRVTDQSLVSMANI